MARLPNKKLVKKPTKCSQLSTTSFIKSNKLIVSIIGQIPLGAGLAKHCEKMDNKDQNKGTLVKT